jgi:hypothetical protein
VLSQLVQHRAAPAICDTANRLNDFVYGAFTLKPLSVPGGLQRPCAPLLLRAERKPDHPTLFRFFFVPVRHAQEQSGARWRRGSQRLCCATGRGAALNQRLRAPARCNTVPLGTIEATGDAGSLNLNVVRRIRAGQMYGSKIVGQLHFDNEAAAYIAACLFYLYDNADW